MLLSLMSQTRMLASDYAFLSLREDGRFLGYATAIKAFFLFGCCLCSYSNSIWISRYDVRHI